jgi:hypothetical protein
MPADMYRLEAVRANGGPHLFPRAFPTVVEACEYAERVMDRLAASATWQVRALRVKLVRNGRVITTINWHDPETDPDPFAPVEVPQLHLGPGPSGIE